MNIVSPLRISGMNMSWNLNLLSGPKWSFTCGHCTCDFKARVPINGMSQKSVMCPHCGSVNRFIATETPLSES
jgi:RNase P subunit RPR2